MAVFTWIESWYNPHRRHSALNYQSPNNFERSHKEKIIEAESQIIMEIHFCLLYPDGQSPVLSQAFDIVAWAAYLPSKTHALAMYNNKSQSRTDENQSSATTLSPASLRELCNRANISEKPCEALIKTTMATAQANWPQLIQKSGILLEQKRRLLHRLKENLSPKNA